MCHCGKPENFDQCCGRFINGEDSAESPEELMRSRYSAFVEKNFEYLHMTQDPQTRSPLDQAANKEFALSAEFTQLEVLASSANGNKGMVEFIAHYKNLKNGELKKHHEVSQFRQQAGVWYFRQGKMKAQ